MRKMSKEEFLEILSRQQRSGLKRGKEKDGGT